MNKIILVLMCLFGILVYTPSQGQILKKLKQKVEQSVDRRVDKRMDKAVEGTLDKTEDGIDNIGKSPNAGDVNNSNDQSKNRESGSKAARQNNVNANYDFEPGARTIFEENFTQEQLGNFPRRLEFIKGNLEVVDWNGGRYGRVIGVTEFAIQLPEKLPEMFTIQLKLHDAFWLGYANLATSQKVEDGESYFQLYYRHDNVGVVTKGGASSLGNSKSIEKGVVPIEIMVDGSYAKMFVNGIRVANIPQTNIKRTDKLYFSFRVGTTDPKDFGYITDIRVAAGGRTLYQTLETEGRIAFNDIHFATGKADILPESSETIGQIAQLLKDHSDLNLLIEGHTDNTGNFDNNMELSKKRADAVKNYLIKNHGIAENRLRSMGQGQTQPVESNDTEEGRSKNRRVEIVKM